MGRPLRRARAWCWSLWLLVAAALVRSAVRSLDGAGNHVQGWGTAGRQYLNGNGVRWWEPDFADGRAAPRQADRPSPRAVSNALAGHAPSRTNTKGRTLMHTFWGQFLDHDILWTPTGNETDFLIQIPPDDPVFHAATMPFTRSRFVTVGDVRMPVNAVSSFLDASQIYGSSPERLAELRDGDRCRLRTSYGRTTIPGELLPFNLGVAGMENEGHFKGKQAMTQIFLAGDVRANENPALTALQTVFLREHNRRCEELAREMPDAEEEVLFEKARSFVIGLVQHVSFDEYLSSTLGEPLPPYRGYNASVNPAVDSFFATVAFRYGHSEVPDSLPMLHPSLPNPLPVLPLRECYYNPSCWDLWGIDPLLNGLAKTLQEEVDIIYTDAIRNFLFGSAERGGTDLFSRNLQRARDHGIPSYNVMRSHLGLKPITEWRELTTEPGLLSALSRLYPAGPHTLDAYVGGLLEPARGQGILGATFASSVEDQYLRLRDGDRFYFANTEVSGLSVEEVTEIQGTKLSDIILRNTNLPKLQCSLFYQEDVNACHKERNQNDLPQQGSRFELLHLSFDAELQMATLSILFRAPDNENRWLAIGFPEEYGRMTNSYAYICFMEAGQPRVLSHSIGNQQTLGCPDGVCRDPSQHVTNVAGSIVNNVLSFNFSRPLAPASGNVLKPGRVVANMASGLVSPDGLFHHHAAYKTSFVTWTTLSHFCTVAAHASVDLSGCVDQTRTAAYSWKQPKDCDGGEPLPPPSTVHCKVYKGLSLVLSVCVVLLVIGSFISGGIAFMFREYSVFRDATLVWYILVALGCCATCSAAFFWFLPLADVLCVLRVRYLACVSTLLFAPCVTQTHLWLHHKQRRHDQRSVLVHISGSPTKAILVSTVTLCALQIIWACVSMRRAPSPAMTSYAVLRAERQMGVLTSEAVLTGQTCAAEPAYNWSAMGLVYLLSLFALANLYFALYTQRQHTKAPAGPARRMSDSVTDHSTRADLALQPLIAEAFVPYVRSSSKYSRSSSKNQKEHANVKGGTMGKEPSAFASAPQETAELQAAQEDMPINPFTSLRQQEQLLDRSWRSRSLQEFQARVQFGLRSALVGIQVLVITYVCLIPWIYDTLSPTPDDLPIPSFFLLLTVCLLLLGVFSSKARYVWKLEKGPGAKLWHAARKRQTAVAAKLLARLEPQDREEAVNWQYKERDGTTPLMQAVLSIPNDAKQPKSADLENQTDSPHAASSSAEACLQQLLEANADVDMADHQGCTALHHAIMCGSLQACDILLREEAAHLFLMNRKLQTPLQTALQRRQHTAARLVEESLQAVQRQYPLAAALLTFAQQRQHYYMLCQQHDRRGHRKRDSRPRRSEHEKGPMSTLSSPSMAEKKSALKSQISGASSPSMADNNRVLSMRAVSTPNSPIGGENKRVLKLSPQADSFRSLICGSPNAGDSRPLVFLNNEGALDDKHNTTAADTDTLQHSPRDSLQHLPRGSRRYSMTIDSRSFKKMLVALFPMDRLGVGGGRSPSGSGVSGGGSGGSGGSAPHMPAGFDPQFWEEWSQEAVDLQQRKGAWRPPSAVLHRLRHQVLELLRSRADPNLAFADTHPLLMACQLGQDGTQAAMLLMAARADVTAQDKHGRTPLLEALSHQQYALALGLIRSGAPIDVVYCNESPLDIAKRNLLRLEAAAAAGQEVNRQLEFASSVVSFMTEYQTVPLINLNELTFLDKLGEGDFGVVFSALYVGIVHAVKVPRFRGPFIEALLEKSNTNKMSAEHSEQDTKRVRLSSTPADATTTSSHQTSFFPSGTVANSSDEHMQSARSGNASSQEKTTPFPQDSPFSLQAAPSSSSSAENLLTRAVDSHEQLNSCTPIQTIVTTSPKDSSSPRAARTIPPSSSQASTLSSARTDAAFSRNACHFLDARAISTDAGSSQAPARHVKSKPTVFHAFRPTSSSLDNSPASSSSSLSQHVASLSRTASSASVAHTTSSPSPLPASSAVVASSTALTPLASATSPTQPNDTFVVHLTNPITSASHTTPWSVSSSTSTLNDGSSSSTTSSSLVAAAKNTYSNHASIPAASVTIQRVSGGSTGSVQSEESAYYNSPDADVYLNIIESEHQKSSASTIQTQAGSAASSDPKYLPSSAAGKASNRSDKSYSKGKASNRSNKSYSTGKNSKFYSLSAEGALRAERSLEFGLFMHEAVISKKIGAKPHVVQFRGADLSRLNTMLIYEFFPGNSLENYLKKAPAKLEALPRMLMQAATGLWAVHKARIVHRDVAARNFLVDAHGGVAICDFGLSQELPRNRTEGVQQGGPWKWMAPEAMPPENTYSYKTDVFMFGILLWEVFARRTPYPDLGHRQAAEQVKVQGLRPHIPKDWPTGYASLMQDCWHASPSCRPTMEQVFDRLKYLQETGAMFEQSGSESASSAAQAFKVVPPTTGQAFSSALSAAQMSIETGYIAAPR